MFSIIPNKYTCTCAPPVNDPCLKRTPMHHCLWICATTTCTIAAATRYCRFYLPPPIFEMYYFLHHVCPIFSFVRHPAIAFPLFPLFLVLNIHTNKPSQYVSNTTRDGLATVQMAATKHHTITHIVGSDQHSLGQCTTKCTAAAAHPTGTTSLAAAVFVVLCIDEQSTTSFVFFAIQSNDKGQL